MSKKLSKIILSDNFFLIALFLIELLKYTFGYCSIKIGNYSFVVAFVTTIIIYAIVLFAFFVCKKIYKIVAMVLYSISSAIFFADMMYFSFFNKLTSVVNITQIKNLSTIEESVKELKFLKYIWIFTDIVLFIIYEIWHRINKNKNRDENYKNNPRVLAVFLISMIIIVCLYSLGVNFKLNYLKSENIIYHITDIENVLFPKAYNLDVSKYINDSTNEDSYYGIIKNKNVVIIQVEALQSTFINKSYNNKPVTPFLNSLVNNNSFYFENYFCQVGLGNTSDAEMAINNSIFPSTKDSTYEKYTNNDYYGLPKILKDNGYKTTNVFHGNTPDFWNRKKAYPYQGFDRFYSSEDFTESYKINFGINDEEFFKQSADIISKSEAPFYSFLITVSSHHPFTIDPSLCDIKLKDEDKDTLFGNYICSINYADSAIEKFINELKENGLYDDTVFVIYGDHFGLPNYDEDTCLRLSNYLGREYTYVDMLSVPMIIHIPNSNIKQNIKTVMGHVDFLPTFLHLLGIKNDKSIMMGKDIFSTQDNTVVEQLLIGEGSIITNDYLYYVSSSGINTFNKAYSLKTKKEIEITDEMNKKSKKALEYIKDANAILENNMIRIK